jgi:hypothetical protein
VTQDQTLLLTYLLALIGRIPRILERWKAPFLNGPGWFFGIEVPSAFFENAGRAILSRYRQRLFLPWLIELPVCAALFFTDHKVSILIVVFVMTLLTRLNYYADRQWAENRARHFEVSRPAKPVVGVALSLRPRTLMAYTNPWLEAPIVIAICGSLLWLVYRYTVLGNWQALRGPVNVTLFSVYLQIGLLLVKRGFVRARSAAPVGNSEQYMVWRESLRRLSTSVCDYTRLLFVFLPITVDLASVTDHWQGSAPQTGTLIFVSVLTPILLWREWRIRQQHLKVARATKPSGFLVLPDTVQADGFLCFKPSLPILLLKGPTGYVLNLASAPAKTAGLYFAGWGLLLVCLSR